MMLSSLFAMPFTLIPKPATAVTLGVVLNLFFKRYPELKERLKELSGKIFEFHVEDQDQSFFMEVDGDGQVLVHTYSDSLPHVVMAGSAGAFLSLLFSTTDPDSLFFSRQLKLSGETDTGLRFKNILDNVEIDWDKELTVLFGAATARMLLSLAKQARQLGEQGKNRLESEMELWMKGHDIPHSNQLTALQQKAEALAKDLERLDGRMARVSKRLALMGTGLSDSAQKSD
ncbi:MAG: SCP2 sterol-binding domain-containing protein [Magnetococcales bacterium]|nr:SCP2 sterol-binding domain-containing protein [Magnetococcales bacterium]MBF0439922.1 SCP2 sterol-binding domain-containing protein [Magnetococcales bacterium]